MHRFRIVVINIVLWAIAISIAYSAFLLDRILSFRLPEALALAAWPLLIIGASILSWAVIVLVKHSGTTGAPGIPAKKLVAKGPYARVRNPIYGADAIIILGLAFLARSPFMLLYDILYAFGIDYYVRMREEPALQQRFGEEYTGYKAAVPRWFPRISPAKK